jgi:hypothetical protein
MGFDAKKVISKYHDTILLEEEHRVISRQINEMNLKKIKLEDSCSILQERLNWHNEKLSIYYKLQYMGFGLELNTLYNTIMEIAQENCVLFEEAIADFFKKLELWCNMKARDPSYDIIMHSREYRWT